MVTLSTFFSIFLPCNSFLLNVCKLTQLALKTRLLSFYKHTELVGAIYSSRSRTNYIVLPMGGFQRCLMSLFLTRTRSCRLFTDSTYANVRKSRHLRRYWASSKTQIARTGTLLRYKHCCKQNTKHFPESKTLPWIQKHFPESKTLLRIQKHFPESKTLPRIQKHFPESKTLLRIQKYFSESETSPESGVWKSSSNPCLQSS